MTENRALPVVVSLTCVLVACGGPERRVVEEVTDLVWLLEAEGVEHNGVSSDVRAVGEDRRPVIAVETPQVARIGPISGDDCTLHFGWGLPERQWGTRGPIEVSVSLETGTSEEVLYTESFARDVEAPSIWAEREVKLENAVDGEMWVGLSGTVEGARPLRAMTWWGSPHVRCRREVLEPKRSRPDLVLVSLDTFRRDRLGTYGHPGGLTPNLDALADEAVVFDNAFAVASYTLPTHASMFTGLYPEEHRAGHDHMRSPLPKDITTLAERLREAGYLTVGFSAGGTVSREMALDRGFEEWTERRNVSLASTVPAVLDVFRRRDDRPVFVFLHTYDAHAPYRSLPATSGPAEGSEGEPGIAEAEDDASADDRESDGDWTDIEGVYYHRHHALERFSSGEDLAAAYDRGVAVVDESLGQLLDDLHKNGLLDPALLVVTSDHGESLYERRRYFGHGHTLREPEIRIPLLVRLPGGTERGRRAGLVQHVDLMPLVLARLGLDPQPSIAGIDPLAQAGARGRVRGETSIAGSLYARDERWKVISPPGGHWQRRLPRLFATTADRFEQTWQLYDLENDPEEETNLFGVLEVYPPGARELARLLRDLSPPGPKTGKEPPMDSELEAHLRALGYVD